MPTYAELESEAVYRNEQVGLALKAFGVRCRNHFGVSADAFGAKGNNLHLRGRHRSLEWNLKSAFVSGNRNYGTVDKRDTAGGHRLIRAFDLGLPSAVLHKVSRNLDAACRDGRAYMLAEYFGDMGDDSIVDGWFEGHDSTSDSSHKTHLHGGLWTIYADDAGAYDDLFNIMIGADMADDYGPFGKPAAVGARTEPVLVADLWRDFREGVGAYETAPNPRGGVMARLDRIETALANAGTPTIDYDKLAAALAKLGIPTAEQIADAVADEQAARLQA